LVTAGFEWISFTTDYGMADGFVAVCKGVIATIAPSAAVVDVTHQVPPQDVRRGSVVLAQTAPWLPPAVHLAVVDPGVGTTRRGIAVATPRGTLVGPDNGLLLPAADALGGVVEAYELTAPAFRLREVSATFHGRDVFAPAAAHLARGVEPARLGPPVPADDLVRLPAPTVQAGPDGLRAEVLTVDTFGTLQLAATAADLDRAGLHVGTKATVRSADASRPAWIGRTFADVPAGALVVLVDSAGHVAVAVNGGSAAAELGTGAGRELAVRPDRP
jgi:S-adenosyl-L-methionine hydrolase (adenosine-forming)